MNFLTLYVFDSIKSLLLDTSDSRNFPDVPPFHIHCSCLDTLCVSFQLADTLPVRPLSVGQHLHSVFFFLNFCLHTDWSVLSTHGWHSIIRVHCDGYRAGLQKVLNLALMCKFSKKVLVHFFLCWYLIRVVATRAWEICFFIYIVT
jgi:hypothetical protein